jgi:hypothetical protein
MVKALNSFAEKGGLYPARIIIFRDGVSNS